MPELTESYFDLRSMALKAVDDGRLRPLSDYATVSGIVVDVPALGGFATLVALADNTTSLYTSVGAETFRTGSHGAVAVETQRLLRTADLYVDAFTEQDDLDLPPHGLVRFHLLSLTGGRIVDVPEASFWGREPHVLGPLIAAALTVITKVREASPPPGPTAR